MDDRIHWETMYEKSEPTDLGWYQPMLSLSLSLIDAAGLEPNASIIDVGGGASTLVDALLERGCERVTVLDISSAALDAVKHRLGPRVARVNFLVQDVGDLASVHAFDLWHDRALFHFLTEKGARCQYLEAMTRALVPGGHVIIATFALDGPPKCSGLDVVRYSPQTLQATIGPSFSLEETREEIHRTPWNLEQKFIYCRFRKRV